MTENKIVALLKETLGANEVLHAVTKKNDVELELTPLKIRQAVNALKNEGYNHIITIIPVEEHGYIKLKYFLEKEGVLAVLKINLSCDNPTVDSVSDIMLAAESFEKEIRDLYGVNFNGLKPSKIILPDNWPEKPVMKRT